MARRAGRKRTARKRAKVELVKMAELARRSGVPAPTIKHYIREGLLPGPEVRTYRNMAYYDAALAARIRVIKSLQAERFLPLRVIGELLEPAPSAALRGDKAGQRRALVALAPVVGGAQRATAGKRRSRGEVMRAIGVTARELDQLEKAGVLARAGRSASYAGRDLELLDVLGEVRALGLGDVFPPAIARTYLTAVKKLVAAEIEVFRRHALGRTLPRPLPEIARHADALGERLVIALRAKLLPALLEEISRAR